MAESVSLLKIVEDTIVDGPGFRLSLYAAGCSHHCKECHNPHSWQIENGTFYSVQTIFERVMKSSSNITFTGGDPFFQTEAFSKLAELIKQNSRKNIWCYTGYLFEDLVTSEKFRRLLNYIDVLVDGPYVAQKRDVNLLFRGSANQRLIDVKKSLESGIVTLYDYTPYPIF